MPFDSSSFQVQTDSFPPQNDNPQVGTVYEVAIDGTGYMLADQPGEAAYRKRIISLAPERLVTQDSVLDMPSERYAHFTTADFSGGEGRKVAPRDNDDPTSFWRGTCRLLPTGAVTAPPVWIKRTSPGAALVGLAAAASTGGADPDKLWTRDVVTTTKVYYTTDEGQSWTTLTFPENLASLTADSQQAYVGSATTGKIWRFVNSVPGSPWANLTGIDRVHVLHWSPSALRLCAIVRPTGSSTATRFTTFNDSGAEEVSGGRLNILSGRLTGMVSAPGAVYIVGWLNTGTSVWRWDITSNPPVQVGWFPNVAPRSMAVGRAGELYLLVTSGQPQELLQGIPDGSSVTWRQMWRSSHRTETTWETVADPTDTGVYYDGHVVLPVTSPEDALTYLASVLTTTGGFAFWGPLDGAAPTAGPRGLAVVTPSSLYAVGGNSLYIASTTKGAGGQIDLPLVDGASSSSKIWDQVRVELEPLPSGATVTVAVSVDGNAYTTIGTINTPNVRSATFPVGLRSGRLSVRLSLTATDRPPVVLLVQTRYHIVPIMDEVVQVPINCSDQLSDLRGRPLPESGPGKGLARAAHLTSLVNQVVWFQDVDWPWTGNGRYAEVVDAQVIERAATLDRAKGRRRGDLVCVLTLRRMLP